MGFAALSFLFFVGVWVVLAYSHAYEHLVAQGKGHEVRVTREDYKWKKSSNRFVPTPARIFNFGVLAPGIYRPLAWLYFLGIFGAQVPAVAWLVTNNATADVWIPVTVALFCAGAAFATNCQYLDAARTAWSPTEAEDEDQPFAPLMVVQCSIAQVRLDAAHSGRLSRGHANKRLRRGASPTTSGEQDGVSHPAPPRQG